MLLFKKSLFAFKAIIFILASTLLLSACSFAPIYGNKGQINNMSNLSYAKPNTRLEQIIYQDLKLKLGEKANSSLVTIIVSNSTKSVARTSNSTPFTIIETILNATISVTDAKDASIIFSGKRRASASYSTNGQRIADLKAFEDANKKAALELAQIIRLTLIGALSTASPSND